MKSQNLVPNPSFEDTLSCPTAGGQIYNAPPWFNPTFNTPDYYNECSSNMNANAPSNFIGYQSAKNGKAYAGFGTAINNNGREYIEVLLLDTLVTNEKYCVDFFVSLANKSMYGIDKIGIYISKDSILDYTSLFNLPYVPQIENPTNNVIADTLDWTLVSGEYTAGGGEKFITIGNFYTNSNTNFDTLNGTWNMAYYYIDDVRVILCDSVISVTEIKNDFKISLYPNPSNGAMQLSYELQKSSNAAFTIYDVLGKKEAEYELQSASKTLFINEPNLRSGIYFYKVVVDNEVIKSDKLIIIK